MILRVGASCGQPHQVFRQQTGAETQMNKDKLYWDSWALIEMLCNTGWHSDDYEGVFEVLWLPAWLHGKRDSTIFTICGHGSGNIIAGAHRTLSTLVMPTSAFWLVLKVVQKMLANDSVFWLCFWKDGENEIILWLILGSFEIY